MQSESTLDPSNELFHQYQALKESKDLLEGVFNSLEIGISVFEAIRDTQGNIQDFKLKIMNKEVERQTNRTDLVGTAYAEEYPSIHELGIFDMMLKVMKTGEPGRLEYFYKQPGAERWFSCMFVKMNDGLIATNVELEKLKNYNVLRQSEDFAQIGNWDYDLLTGVFTWTHGMYSLFNLVEKEAVGPEVYLQYATEKSKGTARKLVQLITTGAGDFEKILDVEVDGAVKTLRVKGVVIKDSTNKAVSVYGIDQDITQQVKLQQEKLRLQNQYKEILANHNERMLKTTLKTQEEERKRISESLHNGLGQLLYGVKLSLDQLSKTTDNPDLAKVIRKTTDDLLTQAIKETRRISHELSPAILENFGLQVAVKDICQQFGPALNMHCDFQESNIKISKELELVIYRTIQELSTNIIKHAKATEANLEVFFSKDQVNINIQDNGQGIKPGKEDGIGLKTIQNQLNLLKGTFTMTSPGGIGTLIKITIPNTMKKSKPNVWNGK
jgi:two-component system NarL family sensor kinase